MSLLPSFLFVHSYTPSIPVTLFKQTSPYLSFSFLRALFHTFPFLFGQSLVSHLTTFTERERKNQRDESFTRLFPIHDLFRDQSRQLLHLLNSLITHPSLLIRFSQRSILSSNQSLSPFHKSFFTLFSPNWNDMTMICCLEQ